MQRRGGATPSPQIFWRRTAAVRRCVFSAEETTVAHARDADVDDTVARQRSAPAGAALQDDAVARQPSAPAAAALQDDAVARQRSAPAAASLPPLASNDT